VKLFSVVYKTFRKRNKIQIKKKNKIRNVVIQGHNQLVQGHNQVQGMESIQIDVWGLIKVMTGLQKVLLMVHLQAVLPEVHLVTSLILTFERFPVKIAHSAIKMTS